MKTITSKTEVRLVDLSGVDFNVANGREEWRGTLGEFIADNAIGDAEQAEIVHSLATSGLHVFGGGAEPLTVLEVLHSAALPFACVLMWRGAHETEQFASELAARMFACNAMLSAAVLDRALVATITNLGSGDVIWFRQHSPLDKRRPSAAAA